MYLIRNVNDHDEYWSNEFGWTSRSYADLFSDKEKHHFNLPLDGEWHYFQNLPAEHLEALSILDDFCADVEAIGLDELNWPNLAITYQRACKLVRDEDFLNE